MMLDLALCAIGLIINRASPDLFQLREHALTSPSTPVTPAPTGVKYVGLIITACGAYGGLPTVRPLVPLEVARMLILFLLPQSVTWLTNNLSGQTKRATGSAFQIGIGVRIDWHATVPSEVDDACLRRTWAPLPRPTSTARRISRTTTLVVSRRCPRIGHSRRDR